MNPSRLSNNVNSSSKNILLEELEVRARYKEDFQYRIKDIAKEFRA